MFYSHEVLTSRKYGVATVWLVATLGSKSSLKRINRKQILEVDVSRACQTIVDPVAPMALRLQGNLLYGVSRVYLQQCGYVLSDAQNAHNAMRMMLRTVKNAALDPNAGKARPDQLVLPDDPSFLPEFALPPPELLAELDFNLNFNLNVSRPGESESLTPFGSQQSQSSAVGGLILPTSSPARPGEFELEGDHGIGSVGEPSGMPGAGEPVELGEPSFMFGDDGDIVIMTPRKPAAATPGGTGGTTMSGDAGASARVRREHEEGQQDGAQFPGEQMDFDLPIYGDDLPEGEAFSSAAQQQSSQHSEVVESSETFAAPMRRQRRAPRVLPTDAAVELRNKDLADWSDNYRQNMKSAARLKIQNRAAAQAKKNAEYYVWGAGIGGIGQQLINTKGPNPFDMFFGDNLFELVTGVSRKKVAGSKHDRDSGIDDATQEESRRVRQKSGEPEEQAGRGAVDEGLFLAGGDEEVELPREGVTPLDDQQIASAMPWNISASIRGSSAIPRSGRVGIIGSTDQGKRGSRLVSESPLLGRGRPSALEGLKSLESDGGNGGDEFGLPGPSSDFPEPAAPLDTSARVREALSAEGENFLTFVTEAIVEKRNRARADLGLMSDVLQAEAAADIEDITFEALLPPAENTKMIACQGLMMVLTLGIKGMLDVQQPEDLGDINLKLTNRAKAMQVIEVSEGEESEDEEASEGDAGGEDEQPVPQEEVQDEDAQEEAVMEKEEPVDPEKVQGEEMQDDVAMEEEDGHFQEQIAAGLALPEHDDHDSLYGD
ncbi:hypothetical protein EJ02DRAFT_512039 [Clathrospora elynae]|uniref:Rad21/Rec8-like protein N-terminal domain-containing protein n=1 Tax=Clathrospora elynae TaxID=706981 RepID=A0A6A5SPL3_9PLEO|nr:hypothetical protein EJ02DRAFT_512039 [Clathrospora elynae]